MSKMAARVCFCLLASLLSAFATDVPVLMWSPERPLRDLPQAPAIDSIDQDHFHSKYLTPLLSKEPHVIVAFLQDKLHINDISKYADVYDENSDGGAFKNIKSLLDDNFSLELPHVLGSHLALDTLKQNFPGTVHDLTSDSDLSDLDLGGKGSYLVIVRLAPVAGAQNEKAAIAANDELVGKVCKHLQKRNVKYTALYTAETSAQKSDVESRFSRHLLEAPEIVENGTFFNMSYTNGTAYAYLTSITACIVFNYDPDNQPKFCPLNFTIKNEALEKGAEMKVVSEVNNTLNVVLTINNFKANSSDVVSYNFSLTMPFTRMFDRWEIQEMLLSLKDSKGNISISDQRMVTRGYDPVVPLLYSYHCTAYEWFPKNMSVAPLAAVVIGGFQIQPFNTNEGGFSLSQDCVGWFSTAIWMALVPIGINIVILLFGMYMIASLSTNDRFDDPKGKSLTINAGE